MGSTLTNGIYLPAEGERNCYTGLAANWTALDSLIGGYNAHIGNATIHVTAEDKAKWDTVTGKADASALTAHTGDTTIHVTAEDKAAWNGKANDANVVHKSGNETVGGKKTFSEDLVINNSDTSQTSKRLVIKSSKVNLGDSNSDSWGISFNAGLSYVSAVDSEKSYSAQGLRFIVRTRDGNNNLISASYRLRVYADGSAYLSPSVTDYISLGSNREKWKDTCTNLINGLEPSSLSLPSGNANAMVDISSYLSNLDGTNNTYVAPANGWISITMSNSTGIQAYINGLWGHQIVRPTVGVVRFFMPVLKNKTINILIFGGAIDNARFIPCQGNV